MSPWLNLSHREFEQFCYVLLERNKFKNLQWYGDGGNDRGRDIICTKSETPIPGTEVQRQWVIQCKHYSKSKLKKSTILEWLAACREHRPDSVLLIVSRSLSANVRDWLKSVKTDYPFEILLWEESDLRREYDRHGAALRKLFPHLPKIRRPVLFYNLKPTDQLVACNEFEDIGFIVWNCDDEKEVMRAVQEFVEFIKANEFRFDGIRD